jgi:hypothetical protein
MGPSRILNLCKLAILILAMGCRSLPHCDSTAAKAPPGTNVLSRHVIEVTSEGFLVDLASRKKGEVIKDRRALTRYLQTNILDGFKESGKRHILLFVHGGLTDRGIGMRHFSRNYQTASF